MSNLIPKIMVGLLIAILSLLLTIMALNQSSKIWLVKIVICCYLSTFVFSWLFFDYNFWYQESMFTQANLKTYFDNQILFKVLITIILVWLSLNYVIKKLLLIYLKTRIAKKIQMLYDNTLIRRIIISNSVKLLKKFYTKIEIDLEYDKMKDKIAENISFIIQLIIVWTTLTTFSLFEYFVFYIICFFIIFVWILIPSLQPTFPELNDVLKNEF